MPESLGESWGAGHVPALSDRVLFCFPDEQNYLLRDAEAEVLFSFSLEESLKRAHVSPLFKVYLKGKSDTSA